MILIFLLTLHLSIGVLCGDSFEIDDDDDEFRGDLDDIAAFFNETIPWSRKGRLDDPDHFWHVNAWLSGSISYTFSNLLNGKLPSIPYSQIGDYVEFWLYTNGQEPGWSIKPNCTDCLDTYIRGKPLIVLCHGWWGSPSRRFGSVFREAFQNYTKTVNVLFVNWEKLAGGTYHTAAILNVSPVGKYTAQLINYLVDEGVTTLDHIHFIGHSLGSHVGNYVSHHIQNGKMARITALDPANPLFRKLDNIHRIDASDAQFVDVIHTASKNYVPKGSLGFLEPCGHVDFYPNYGRKQPECSIIKDVLLFGHCSHGMAYKYFARTITNPYLYPACECDNWEEIKAKNCTCNGHQDVVMGWATSSKTRGIFIVEVNGTKEANDVAASSARKSVIAFETISIIALIVFIIKVLLI